jgi:hypothetical protein
VTFLKSGYTFSMTGTSLAAAPASCNGLAAGLGAPGYVTAADPLETTANPHFFGSNADGTIYEAGSTFNGVLPESGPSPLGTAIK